VNRFLTTHQHNNAIHVGSHWKIWDKRQIKHTDNTQAKHNPEKANNAKQNYSISFAFYDNRPGIKVGLPYSTTPLSQQGAHKNYKMAI